MVRNWLQPTFEMDAGEPVIPRQVGDPQVVQKDRSVGSAQGEGGLVLNVAPPHRLVMLGVQLSGPFAVTAPLLAAGQAPLSPGQFVSASRS